MTCLGTGFIFSGLKFKVSFCTSSAWRKRSGVNVCELTVIPMTAKNSEAGNRFFSTISMDEVCGRGSWIVLLLHLWLRQTPWKSHKILLKSKYCLWDSRWGDWNGKRRRRMSAPESKRFLLLYVYRGGGGLWGPSENVQRGTVDFEISSSRNFHSQVLKSYLGESQHLRFFSLFGTKDRANPGVSMFFGLIMIIVTVKSTAAAIFIIYVLVRNCTRGIRKK